MGNRFSPLVYIAHILGSTHLSTTDRLCGVVLALFADSAGRVASATSVVTDNLQVSPATARRTLAHLAGAGLAEPGELTRPGGLSVFLCVPEGVEPRPVGAVL